MTYFPILPRPRCSPSPHLPISQAEFSIAPSSIDPDLSSTPIVGSHSLCELVVSRVIIIWWWRTRRWSLDRGDFLLGWIDVYKSVDAEHQTCMVPIPAAKLNILAFVCVVKLRSAALVLFGRYLEEVIRVWIGNEIAHLLRRCAIVKFVVAEDVWCALDQLSLVVWERCRTIRDSWSSGNVYHEVLDSLLLVAMDIVDLSDAGTTEHAGLKDSARSGTC